MTIRSTLKEIPLFSELDTTSLDALSKVALHRKIDSGVMLFSEGDPASAFFVLLKGSVQLTKMHTSGREQIIRVVRPHEIFAEVVAFSEEPYPVMATVVQTSELLVFQRKDFVRFIQQHPNMSLKMMGAMAKLMRHLNTLVMDMSLGSVASRLATFLLECYRHAGSKTFDLGMSKKELAHQLGTVPETLSRNFRQFQADGWIEMDKKRCKIKSLKNIQKISQN